MFESRYEKLNQKQREAVDQIYGPVLVVAGPGTGKTELLSLRTANILLKSDTAPGNILLLTFTESGAENMRERLSNLIGERAYKINIFTFHAFASYIISQYPNSFFDGHKFEPATEIDQQAILEKIFKELKRSDPLSSFHPEMGYAYIRDAASLIKDLKRGNLSPEDFLNVLENNLKEIKKAKNILKPLDEISGKRKYSEVLVGYIKVLENLKKVNGEIFTMHREKLEKYIELSGREQKTTLFTEWKKKYLEKNESGEFIFKEENPERIEKLFSLQNIFKLYQEELYNIGKYDFDDMILLVNQALKNDKKLLEDLKERFQFIMLDEFQDTNDAQFNLASKLCENVENPNILAVGDDDQAIFKFQGAEINNIKKFLASFESVKVITLNDNYRSTQEILDYSRIVIQKGVERLENFDKNINKQLTSKNPNLSKGNIIEKSFSSEIFEFEYIASEIKKIFEKGVKGENIAIICRKHSNLRKISEFLSHHKIHVEYEKESNVLEFQLVRELVVILKFLSDFSNYKDESLLPEILSFKMFNLDRLDIWEEISKCENNQVEFDEFGKKVFSQKSLLTHLKNSQNQAISKLANFILNLLVESKSTPLPHLIDKIIGQGDIQEEDLDYLVSDTEIKFSYFKNYYFPKNQSKESYVESLLALKTFVEAIREFKQGQEIFLKDFKSFIEIYESKDFTLSLKTPFKSGENAVSLLTAHKAKGLEFEYVFLLSTDDKTWKKASLGSKISLPINLPLQATQDTDDDKLRLLYVALTRSKHTLYITHTGQILEYLAKEGESKGEHLELEDITNETLETLKINTFDLKLDEMSFLKKRLENYKMPVTHLINFLNFPKVGPEKFVEQNILRYPQAMSGSAAYGSAIHSAIEKYFLYFEKNDKKPTLKFVLESYENSLLNMRLPKQDFKKYLESGEEVLKKYIKYIEKRGILKNTKVEVKFANEGVVLEKAKLTGNIDKIEFVDEEILVTDLKTGSQVYSWEEGSSDWEKTKMHFYKYQLAYYAILLENSQNYSKYKVKVCSLEFVEPDKNEKIENLPLLIDEELKNRVKSLIKIIYNKIQNLDFPDTSTYSKNYKGILAFEEDLLKVNQ
jgi:DNA helicase-2/ATP-dependent DNA helicase PcrA